MNKRTYTDPLFVDTTSREAFSEKNLSAEKKEFFEKCKPKLEALETIRLAKLKIYEYRKKIAIPIGSVVTPVCGFIDYWLLKIQTGSDDEFVGVTFLALFVLYRWVTAPKRQYAKAYKKDILPDIADLFGPFTYKADGKIRMGEMKPSKIVPHHHNYKSEDYFTGNYKGIDIQFCEMKLTKQVRSGKRTRTVTVFKGLSILLKPNNKKFYGHTILDKDMGRKISKWFKEKGTKLKQADLVDPEFEKVFDVYTDDQVEARYLIDPNMMEDIKSLYHEYNGEKMAAAFYEEGMLIMIASKHNYFEPADIHIRATSPQSILSMKKEIEKILSIVDKLSLYDPRKAHEAEASNDTTLSGNPLRETI